MSTVKERESRETEQEPEERCSDDGPICPHCRHQIIADENRYYDEDYAEDDCPNCGKTFRVMVYKPVTWWTWIRRKEREMGQDTGNSPQALSDSVSNERDRLRAENAEVGMGNR